MIDFGCNQNELDFMKPEEKDEDPWQSKNGDGTLVFLYLTNRHLYPALKNEAFANNIRRWILSVSECCIIHSRSAETPLKQFCDSDKLSLLQGSNENEAQEHHQSKGKQRRYHGVSLQTTKHTSKVVISDGSINENYVLSDGKYLMTLHSSRVL